MLRCDGHLEPLSGRSTRVHHSTPGAIAGHARVGTGGKSRLFCANASGTGSFTPAACEARTFSLDLTAAGYRARGTARGSC